MADHAPDSHAPRHNDMPTAFVGLLLGAVALLAVNLVIITLTAGKFAGHATEAGATH
jgi:hypothetical protein